MFIVSVILFLKGTLNVGKSFSSPKKTKEIYKEYMEKRHSPTTNELEEQIEIIIEKSNKEIIGSALIDILIAIIVFVVLGLN